MLYISTRQIGDFNYLLNEVKNPKPLLEAWAAYRRSAFRQQIARRVDPYDEPYAPLTAAYLKQKRKKWGNRPILSASGRMVKTHDVKVIGSYVREVIGGAAQYHQRGNKRLKRRLLMYDSRGLPAAAQNKLLELAIKRIKR